MISLCLGLHLISGTVLGLTRKQPASYGLAGRFLTEFEMRTVVDAKSRPRCRLNYRCRYVEFAYRFLAASIPSRWIVVVFVESRVQVYAATSCRPRGLCLPDGWNSSSTTCDERLVISHGDLCAQFSVCSNDRPRTTPHSQHSHNAVTRNLFRGRGFARPFRPFPSFPFPRFSPPSLSPLCSATFPPTRLWPTTYWVSSIRSNSFSRR